MLASTPGRVRRTGYESPSFGRFVEIGQDRGLTSLYAHLSRVDLHPGDRVVIGAVGSTSCSTGPHLRFEVRCRGWPLKPEPVVGQILQIETTV